MVGEYGKRLAFQEIFELFYGQMNTKSSQSKVAYFRSGFLSCQLKNANGLHRALIFCSRTAPTAVSDASLVRAVGAFRTGWCSITAEAKASLVFSKAVVITSDQTRVFGLGRPDRAW